jgi:phytoene dehydrogenase-like protein
MAFGVDTQKELDEIYMDAMQKRLPKYPGGFLCEACLWDKSQVPDGKSAFFWWLFSTYDLEGDPKTWDYKREEILNEWIDYLRKYCTNLTDDNIISKAIYTPLDIERRTIAMRKGAMLLGDPTLDVMFYYRPWHGASHYKIEDVERLYLTGGTTHPMGGISMMCGYNCANQIAEDLNIKKWWERS